MMSQLSNDSETLRAQTLGYLKGELTGEEKGFFEAMLIESEDLRRELSRSRALLDALHSADDGPARETVNRLIRSALERDVSDIHFEPRRNDARVRVRIDGVLHEGELLPRETYPAIVNRWKMMADMDVAERRVPQTGRVPVEHAGAEYELRVHILPSLHGEKVVVRVVSRSGTLVGLERLNIGATHRAALKRLASLRSGLVITSGMNGVGKTTLLYSLLQEMQRDAARRSIATVEDPIEFVLGDDVTQTGVNRPAGLTFASAIAALLHSDSDVIYCGEMRDLATAEGAIEAAVTGKLVLTALHTNSAMAVVPRLRDIGIENFLIADTAAGLIGQRLVRRVDTRQTEEYEPEAADLARLGLSRADGPFRRGIASEANHGTGFAGRLPLLEVAEVGEELRRHIAAGASTRDLEAVAWPNGGSLLDDGRAKIREGLTTVEEVVRALGYFGA